MVGLVLLDRPYGLAPGFAPSGLYEGLTQAV
jgi:hypothetical protein